MPAKIVTLHDIENTIIYPETIASAIRMPDGRRSLLAELDDLNDESCVTEFNNDGTITKTMTNSGMVTTTSFNNDGSITDYCEYPDGTEYFTKTTTFNSDGSITVSKVYADNSGGGS